jgi:putative transcription antitermination factor YqgF
MTVYLGLDYGRAHIGTALAERSLATPLATIKNTGRTEVIAHLHRYIADHRVETIICGVPEGELKAEIESFAQTLRESTGVPVILHPETLSSQEAIAKLRQGGASQKKLQNDHAYAAVLILEDYLDQQGMVI